MTNIPSFAEELDQLCNDECRKFPHGKIEGYQHDAKTGRRVQVSKHAQHYPEGLVKAICRSIKKNKDAKACITASSSETADPEDLKKV